MAYGYTSLLYSHFYQGCGYTEQLLTKLWTSCLFLSSGNGYQICNQRFTSTRQALYIMLLIFQLRLYPFYFLAHARKHTHVLYRKKILKSF